MNTIKCGRVQSVLSHFFMFNIYHFTRLYIKLIEMYSLYIKVSNFNLLNINNVT